MIMPLHEFFNNYLSRRKKRENVPDQIPGKGK